MVEYTGKDKKKMPDKFPAFGFGVRWCKCGGYIYGRAIAPNKENTKMIHYAIWCSDCEEMRVPREEKDDGATNTHDREKTNGNRCTRTNGTNQD